MLKNDNIDNDNLYFYYPKAKRHPQLFSTGCNMKKMSEGKGPKKKKNPKYYGFHL